MDINDEEKAAKLLEGLEFDAAADFIAFRKEHLERDYRLLRGKTKAVCLYQLRFRPTRSRWQII